MSKNFLQERLINGFSRFGYSLAADDDSGIHNEFRKADAALVFTVKPGEGAVNLYWTENGEHDLVTPTLYNLTSDIPPDVQHRVFCGSPDEFWQAVENIINSSN